MKKTPHILRKVAWGGTIDGRKSDPTARWHTSFLELFSYSLLLAMSGQQKKVHCPPAKGDCAQRGRLCGNGVHAGSSTALRRSPLPEGAYEVASLPRVGKWRLCAEGSSCGFAGGASPSPTVGEWSSCAEGSLRGFARSTTGGKIAYQKQKSPLTRALIQNCRYISR